MGTGSVVRPAGEVKSCGSQRYSSWLSYSEIPWRFLWRWGHWGFTAGAPLLESPQPKPQCCVVNQFFVSLVHIKAAKWQIVLLWTCQGGFQRAQTALEQWDEIQRWHAGTLTGNPLSCSSITAAGHESVFNGAVVSVAIVRVNEGGTAGARYPTLSLLMASTKDTHHKQTSRQTWYAASPPCCIPVSHKTVDGSFSTRLSVLQEWPGRYEET